MTMCLEQQHRLMALIHGALQAVSPEPALLAALSLDGDVLTVDGVPYDLSAFERVLIIGAGKASAAMAKTLEELLGDRLHSGVVATKYGHGLVLDKTTVLEAAHPVPDEAGVRASDELLRAAQAATERDLVLCLLSGGASAIIPAPRQPVTLADKQTATRRLLECGATIDEINAIRKHLSTIKGGHLAKALEPATVVSLIISDVIGDHLDVIGSGPTAPDNSTFFDCRAILDRYELCAAVPPVVLETIDAGVAGREPETRKAGDPCFERVRNVIVAGNAMAVDGAARTARRLGYAPVVVDDRLQGEAREAGVRLVRAAWDICEGNGETNAPVCLLAGGETTVTINGNGTGGRNQEMALAAAMELARKPEHASRIALACLGTDGTDGPTDAAGALVLPDTMAAAEQGNVSAREHLENNDAYHFFSATGTILKTGPTRTNVMDVAMVLVDPA